MGQCEICKTRGSVTHRNVATRYDFEGMLINEQLYFISDNGNSTEK